MFVLSILLFVFFFLKLLCFTLYYQGCQRSFALNVINRKVSIRKLQNFIIFQCNPPFFWITLVQRFGQLLDPRQNAFLIDVADLWLGLAVADFEDECLEDFLLAWERGPRTHNNGAIGWVVRSLPSHNGSTVDEQARRHVVLHCNAKGLRHASAFLVGFFKFSASKR